jgi:hypothetical protein
MDADIIIMGGGAAGLMGAHLAGATGARVLVLERGSAPARKVLASGGGHCNVTNTSADHTRYISGNPSFTRSALARYTPADALAYLRQHGIAYEEREEGRVFLLGSSRAMKDALLHDCRAAGVRVGLNAGVRSARKTGGAFTVETARGTFSTPRFVIAAGGQSWESLGATPDGYALARAFGHTVTPLRPGLVPLVLGRSNPLQGLAGLAFRASVSTGGHAYTDQVLVTHKGLSGPAILQASSHWREGEPVMLDLLPGMDAREWLDARRGSSRELRAVLAEALPRRLASALALSLDLPGPVRSLPDKAIRTVADALCAFTLRPTGTEGYPRAEVTVGGVDTREVSSRTMESALVPGLHFIGEVLDVTGELGGYNLHWAWASAHALAGSLA